MRLNQFLLLAICAVSSVPLFAQKQFEHITDALYHYTNDSTPGIAVGVVQDGNIIYENYIGYANLAYDIKVSAKSRFNIASTAKQFTALMVLKLSLENKLSLEEDIRKYLPKLYPEVKEEIKIRHIINHTSGIRDYVELMGLLDKIWWKQMGLDNGDIMELMEKQEELGFEPGSEYSYSNSGYVILAELIATVTDKKFTEYSKNYFRELGMEETYFVERYMGTIPNRADPYYDWGSGVWLKTPTITKNCGEGFLFTTLKDQMTYEQLLHNTEVNNTLLTMSQQAIPNSEITSYGFGLELSDWSDRAAVHHSGATYGYHSQMVRFQEEKLTILVLSNNGNLRSDWIADSIASILLPPKEEEKIELNYDSLFYATSSENKSPKITGHYISTKGTVTRIVKEEEKMYWKTENGYMIEIKQEQANQYIPDYDSTLKIRFYDDQLMLFDPDGEIIQYNRKNPYAPSLADLEAFIGTYYNSELDISFDLTFNEEKKLAFSLSTFNEEEEVNLLSQHKFLTEDYILRIEKDPFDRVRDILLTFDRAKNIRFKKKTNFKYQPKIQVGEGSIQVTNIGSKNGDPSNILLTRNDSKGNEIWAKQFGGKSYDRASSILSTEDGYLIIGSTSSYGNGNYDVFIIKTNKEGKKQWQNTFGGHFNEYGYTAEKTEEGYLLKGSIQQCSSKDFLSADCRTNFYMIYVDQYGKKQSEKILEEME